MTNQNLTLTQKMNVIELLEACEKLTRRLKLRNEQLKALMLNYKYCDYNKRQTKKLLHHPQMKND